MHCTVQLCYAMGSMSFEHRLMTLSSRALPQVMAVRGTIYASEP